MAMSPDNLSPVTEAEVMDFSRRICTAIVAHSQQQGQIDTLTRTLETTTTELDYSRSEMARLNKDIGETTSLADSYSKERDEAIKQVQELQGKLRYQEEMAISRDAKVAELTANLSGAVEQRNNRESELDRATSEIDRLMISLGETTQDRDHWRQGAEKAETELSRISNKLAKIPLPIRAHFTGESLDATKPEPVVENKPEPWTPPVEMKPVAEEAPTKYPDWISKS